MLLAALPSIIKLPQEEEVVTCFDSDGQLVATEGLLVLPPWTVVPSTKFQGRWFFYNNKTGQSKWSLPSQLRYMKKRSLGSPRGELFSFEDILVPTGSISSSSSTVNRVTDRNSLFKFPRIRSRGNSVHEMSQKLEKLPTTVSISPQVMMDKDDDSDSDSAQLLEDEKLSCHGDPAEKVAWSPHSSMDNSVDTMSLDQESDESSSTSNKTSSTSLQVLEGLGRGGYSTVVKVMDPKDGVCYAMKVVPKSISERKDKRDNHRKQLINELQIMTELPSCPFLQRCHHAFESPSSVFFLLDLNSGGDLFYHLVTRVQSGSMFSEQECRVLLAELYLALEHLHRHNIVHRDIKIENIMLDVQGHVKLVDFGLSSVMPSRCSPMRAIGSLIYMAPELIRYKTGGRHTDWWAYGVLAYELLSTKTPWSSLLDTKLISKEIVCKEVPPPPHISQEAQSLITGLMRKNPDIRLGTHNDDEIRSCSFFKSIDWEAMSRLELPPAFIPNRDIVNVAQEDQEGALEKYSKIISTMHHSERSSNLQWMIGLDSYTEYLTI